MPRRRGVRKGRCRTACRTQATFTPMFAKRSGSERVRMAREMFDLARALAIANIKAHTDNSPLSNSSCLEQARQFRHDFSASRIASAK